MDAVVVGLLTGVTLLTATALWRLHVRPDLLLGLWEEGALSGDGSLESYLGALIALRWTLAVLLFALAFLTGLVTAFLSSTHAGL